MAVSRFDARRKFNDTVGRGALEFVPGSCPWHFDVVSKYVYDQGFRGRDNLRLPWVPHLSRSREER